MSYKKESVNIRPATKETEITSLIKNLIFRPAILQDIKRPKDIPINATDCGFNHSETKEK